MSQIIVVANARYPVCLDTGRHLHPGEVAEVEDSQRHRHLIDQRQLRLTRNQPKAEPPRIEPPKPAPVRAPEPDRPQEV